MDQQQEFLLLHAVWIHRAAFRILRASHLITAWDEASALSELLVGIKTDVGAYAGTMINVVKPPIWGLCFLPAVWQFVAFSFFSCLETS